MYVTNIDAHVVSSTRPGAPGVRLGINEDRREEGGKWTELKCEGQQREEEECMEGNKSPCAGTGKGQQGMTGKTSVRI